MKIEEIAYSAIMALKPCAEAREWLGANSHLSGVKLLKACPNTDWIIWAVGNLRLFTPRQWIGLVLRLLAGVQFADERSAGAIDLARRWYDCEEVSDEELRLAAAAVYAAAAYAADAYCQGVRKGGAE